MRQSTKIRVLGGALATVLACAGTGMFASAVLAQDAQEITYQNVLDSPDDLRLNLEYARQEVASGRLQQAASALERLLLNRPNWDAVRLFYGIVLYRLDDIAGAKRELELLEGRDLTPSQESDRVKYLALANNKDQSLRITGRISLGGRFDTNPGRAAESAGGAAITATEENDFAFTGSSKLRIESDIGNGQGDYFFLENFSYINGFFDVDQADLVQSNSRLGARLHGRDVAFTPYLHYGTSFYQYEQFRSQYGGGLDTTWSLSSQVSFLLNGRGTYENYRATSYSTIGDLRDGWKTTVESGFRWRPDDTLTLSATGRWARKNAEDDGFSYDQGRVRLTALKLLGEGTYLSLMGSYTRTEYDQPDNFYSAVTTREDDVYFARAAVGSPLGTIFSTFDIELPENIANIVAQVGVQYRAQDSTINQLNINNFSADLIFTKRFAF